MDFLSIGLSEDLATAISGLSDVAIICGFVFFGWIAFLRHKNLERPICRQDLTDLEKRISDKIDAVENRLKGELDAHQKSLKEHDEHNVRDFGRLTQDIRDLRAKL